MDISWEGSIQIEAPITLVYAYLSDLTRHVEWAQSVEHIELMHPGDDAGIGAVYLTFERQALQSDRQPHQSLSGRGGVKESSVAIVRELVPNRRIAWHAYSRPRQAIHADFAFDLAQGIDGGTTLTQTVWMHISQPALLAGCVLLRMRPHGIRTRSGEQWWASLRNIASILESRGGNGE
jgi:hypothetical protein